MLRMCVYMHSRFVENHPIWILQDGPLISEGVLSQWTFFSRQVQPLHQWVTTMWMYPGPSCPDRPFSKELGDAEINTRIHRVLAHGVGLNPGAGPAPFRKGVNNTRVSLFAFTFGNLCNLICSWCSRPPAGPCKFS
jgi:hypothetical protein